MKGFSSQKPLEIFHFLYARKGNLKLFPGGQNEVMAPGSDLQRNFPNGRSLDRINFSRIICNTKLRDAQTHIQR